MFCPECGEVMAPGRFDGRDRAPLRFHSVLSHWVVLMLRRRNEAGSRVPDSEGAR